ncbi:RagB/SusD family nutrient uptake outer membrane protein [Parapedobacter sp. DT-150]|uniref:RagB/SusD family nutrient uptake outer membrane protein n=1 Tax=Parapedobacter sp. DT-150 TaxID=3396162 RepID=UPI003F1AE5F5
MKNILKYNTGLLLTMVLSFAGCSDFLEYQQYGPGDSESFWKTEADVRKGLDAFYEYTSIEECTGRGTFWYENCSDNMVTGRIHVVSDGIKNFTQGASDGSFATTWNEMVRVITKANDVLRYVPKIETISPELKDNAVGQGYFFRGYGYLWLSPWYGDNRNGGIPIITEETTIDELDAPRPASVLENYDMIIADLRKAGELLPSWSQLTPAEQGRPHKTAAWAFAARAALYAAEYDEAKYYPIVIEMCDKIINLTGADKRELHYLAADHDFADKATNSYGLPASNFSDLFRMENNFSKEYIYSIMGSELRSGPKFHGMSFDNGGFSGFNTWGYFTPTAELYEAFEPGDARRDATIMAPGQRIVHPTGAGSLVGREIWLGVPGNAPERATEGITLGETTSSPTNLLNRKMHSIFEVENGYGTVYNTSGDFQSNRLGTVVMRYADVLLMKAEALIWTNGEGDGEAKALLNQIRKRAGLPENSPATKAALKNERRCELAFEFLPSRHIDLVRWGDAKEIYSKALHGYAVKFKKVGDDPYVFDNSEKTVVWPARNFDPVKNHVFPIHTSIIVKSQDILKQNEGW